MPPQLLAVLYVFQFSPLPSLPILSHSPTDARVSSPQLGAAHSGASHRVHCDLHRLVLERRQVKRRRQGRHPRCHMAPPNRAHPTRLGRSHRARRLGRRWRARWSAGARIAEHAASGTAERAAGSSAFAGAGTGARHASRGPAFLSGTSSSRASARG
jgi:hypothetical protein